MKNLMKTLFLTVILGLSPMAVAMDQEFMCKVPTAPALDPDYIPGEQPVKQTELDSKEFAAQVESKRKYHAKNASSSKPEITEQPFATSVNEDDIGTLAKLLNVSACGTSACDYLHGWNAAKVFKGHDAPITHLFDDHSSEFGPHGKESDYFVTTDDTGKINIWHTERSEPVFTHNFNRAIAVINIKPLWAYLGLAYVAVTFKDDPAALWVYTIELKNNAWKMSFSIKFAADHVEPISSIEYFPNDKNTNAFIQTISNNDKQCVGRDFSTGDLKYNWVMPILPDNLIVEHFGCPDCTEYRARGNTIEIRKRTEGDDSDSDEDGDWQTQKILDEHTAEITDLCSFDSRLKYKTNKNFIISTSKDRTVKMWDIKTGECVQTLTGPRKPITKFLTLCQCHKDKENLLLAASEDGCVYMWEFIDSKELENIGRQKPIIAKKKKDKEQQVDEDGSKLGQLFE